MKFSTQSAQVTPGSSSQIFFVVGSCPTPQQAETHTRWNNGVAKRPASPGISGQIEDMNQDYGRQPLASSAGLPCRLQPRAWRREKGVACANGARRRWLCSTAPGSRGSGGARASRPTIGGKGMLVHTPGSGKSPPPHALGAHGCQLTGRGTSCRCVVSASTRPTQALTACSTASSRACVRAQTRAASGHALQAAALESVLAKFVLRVRSAPLPPRRERPPRICAANVGRRANANADR